MTLQETFEKTVFLLGAGSSFEAGCLVSGEMLSRLKPEIINIAADDPNYGKYKKGFLELYRIIHPALAYQSDLKNISAISDSFYKPNIEDYILILRKIINREHLIPEPLVGNWSDKLLQLQVLNEGILTAYLNFLYQCIIKWITPADKYKKARKVLEPVKKLFTDTTEEAYSVNFFTLNYDLVVENVFTKGAEKSVTTGFNQNIWDATAFNIEDVRLNLYKMHGSLDWYQVPHEKDQSKSTPNHQIAFNARQPDEIKPHIILGFENKLFAVDPFFTIVQKFIALTDRANLIVVIGYSFFDNYLNNIIIQSVNQSENKRLLIVDPYWANKSVEEFVKYIHHIQKDVSSLNLNNYETIKSSRIKIYKGRRGNSGAKAFYKDYFKDKCENLLKEHIDLNEKDNPF